MLFPQEHRPFLVSNDPEFDLLAMDMFRFQAEHNKVYSNFLEAININPEDIKKVDEIPFLPISFFKTGEVVSGTFDPEKSFKSSGTTGSERSTHHIKKLSVYRESFIRSFEMYYGDPSDISIYALLPSYLERSDSSLVYMAEKLIGMNKERRGGFFLDNHSGLLNEIKKSKLRGEEILLLGVSFALLDIAEELGPDLSGVIVMETGGMKGRRKELIREELHSSLSEKMNLESVHSEYGMTELLSQAWSSGKGIFRTPPWMKIIIRDPLDPMSSLDFGRTGGINIIDLANIYSCSFIETADLGVLYHDGSFEVSGRFDTSDIRGCNLLI